MNFNVQLENPQQVLNITIEEITPPETPDEQWTKCQTEAETQLLDGQLITGGYSVEKQKLMQYKPDSE